MEGEVFHADGQTDRHEGNSRISQKRLKVAHSIKKFSPAQYVGILHFNRDRRKNKHTGIYEYARNFWQPAPYGLHCRTRGCHKTNRNV